jgi:hypothetical protein
MLTPLAALIACLIGSLGARDQVLLGHLTLRQGARPALLGVAIATGAAGCAVMVGVAALVPDTAPRAMLAALALGLAGALAVLRPARPAPAEPTHSLFAAALVFAAQQFCDITRLLALAAALLMPQPIAVASGFAAGNALALILGWIAPERVTRPALRSVARGIGLILLLASGILAWDAASH